MTRSQGSAQLIVQYDGINVWESRLAIQIDEWNRFLMKCLQQTGISARRTTNYSRNLAFDEQAQGYLFISLVLVGVANQHGVAVGPGDIFRGFNDRGEERIANI